MTHIKVGDIVKFGQDSSLEGHGIVLGIRVGVLGGTGTSSWRSGKGEWIWQQITTPVTDEVLVHGLLCDAYGWYASSNLELISSADSDALP